MKDSGIFKLQVNDFIKGLIMAVIGSVIGLVTAMVESGSIHFDLAALGKGALLAGLGYIVKNWLTSNEGKFLTKDNPSA